VSEESGTHTPYEDMGVPIAIRFCTIVRVSSGEFSTTRGNLALAERYGSVSGKIAEMKCEVNETCREFKMTTVSFIPNIAVGVIVPRKAAYS
jgi:hypothetical protein